MNLNGKRILMTTGGGLGDMICFTPALRRMKELYPDVRITFMTKRGNHEVMQGLPYLEKVIYIIRGKAFGRYRVLPDFWHQDAVVFTDWQPQLLLFSKLFRIPVRAGIPRPGHTLDDFLTKHLKTNVMKSRNYAAETNARLFSEALGIELDGPMDRLDVAMPSERVQSETAALLESIGLEDGQPFLLLSPFASMEQRNWPADSVRAFVQRAEAELHLPVVISAPPQQAELAASFSRYSLAGRTGTMQLVELVCRARLLVTPDSGPMHVAGAVGTDCVALFSKDLPSRWAPRHHCVPIYLGEPCSPCTDETARQCPTVRCMRAITADMVLERCEAMLRGKHPEEDAGVTV